MANKIQIKRGLKANLPLLDVGEPAFTTDTKEFFIGDGISNIDFAKQSDLEITNSQVLDLSFKLAGGTANAITLSMQPLTDGYSKTFIASANNNGAATKINGKPLYKPNTTIAPNLISGKAYTVWYNKAGDCFFIKASAEGDAIAANVLAGKKFSNDNDTGLVGTLDLSNLVSGNIKSGVTINGVQGSGTVVDTRNAVLDPQYLLQGYSGYDDGILKNGTMANLGNYQNAVDTWQNGNGQLVFRIPSKGAFTDVVNGYKPEVSAYDANFIASNIVSGKTIFGLTGNASTSNSKQGTITIPSRTAMHETIYTGWKPKVIICFFVCDATSYTTCLAIYYDAQSGNYKFICGLTGNSGSCSMGVYSLPNSSYIERITDTGFTCLSNGSIANSSLTYYAFG